MGTGTVLRAIAAWLLLVGPGCVLVGPPPSALREMIEEDDDAVEARFDRLDARLQAIEQRLGIETGPDSEPEDVGARIALELERVTERRRAGEGAGGAQPEASRGREDRRRALHESAVIVADVLVDMLVMVAEKPIPEDADPERYKRELSDKYHDKLRRREAKGHDELRKVYSHRELEVETGELSLVVEDDLFSEATW